MKRVKRKLLPILFLLGCGEPFTSVLFGESTGQGGSNAQAGQGGTAGFEETSGNGGAEMVASSVSTGGISTSGTAGNSQGGATNSGGQGGQGASDPCGPATCDGCCDSSGACLAGLSNTACGVAGEACAPCQDACGWSPPAPDTCASEYGISFLSCAAGVCLPEMIGNYTGACCPPGSECVPNGSDGEVNCL